MPDPLALKLNVLSGVPREDGPFTRIQVLREGEERTYLLLVAEARSPDPEDACQWALDRVAGGFATRQRSATGRLLEGMQALHEALARDNGRVFSNERTLVSLVCAYLKGLDLYLAHAGPAQAFAVSARGFRCLAPGPGQEATWLGDTRTPNIWVRHYRLTAGETLLLAGSALGSAPAGVIAAFQERLESGMAAVYRRTRTERAFGALAVAPSPAAASEPEAAGLPDSDPEPKGEPYRYRPGTPRTPGLPANGPPDQWGRRGATPFPTPDLGLALDLRGPPRRVSRWVRELLNPRLLGAIIGLFIIGGLFFGARAVSEGMSDQARQQVAVLADQARAQIDEAARAPSADERRERLTRSVKLLEDALRQRPEDPGARTLLQQARAGLQTLDAVTPLAGARRLLDLTAASGSPVLLRSPVFVGDALYVLDKLGDRVQQASLVPTQGGGGAAAPTTLALLRGPGRRSLSALFWMPRGGTWTRDSLLALDDGHNLQELTAGAEARAVPLRGGADWGSLQTARGFAGNLYVLDPKANQVWRYVPTDNGFDSERRAALPSLDLRDAVDLLVDGDVYVLLRTGTVLKITAGRSVPFSLDGLDRPMTNATALAGGGANRHLYVADPGNRRIAVFDKASGRFVRQLALDDLPPVHSLWVDEAAGRLLLVTDSQVYSAPLPALP